MASKVITYAAAILGLSFVAGLPSISMAKDFVVGDDAGWTINFDYQTWAKSKVFRVGDTIVFKYPVGVHNVFKVDGPAFGNCSVPPPDRALTSGNDRITLATSGRKWYICGVGQHCAVGGQKLVITVLPPAYRSLPPSLPPNSESGDEKETTSAANTIVASGLQALIVAGVAAAAAAAAAMPFIANY